MKIYTEDYLNKLIDESNSLEELKDKLAEVAGTVDLDCLDMQEGEVLVISFPADNAEAVQQLAPFIQQAYPNNPAIAVVNDIDLLVESADEALEMLESMKDKIASMTGKSSVRDQILLK